MATEGGPAKAQVSKQATPWAGALNKLQEWDPAFAEEVVRITTDPWSQGVLPTKFIELVCIGLNAAHTSSNPEGTRRHIRAAIEAGATRHEILFVLKCASVMSLHSIIASAPLLLQEASAWSLEDFGAVRAKRLQKVREATPAVEKLRAIGRWNDEWDSFLFLAPDWTEHYMAMNLAMYRDNVLSPKELELLLVAFDVSYPEIYASYARLHIKKAFRAGATIDEITQVLKLGVVQGVQACNFAVGILAEELDHAAADPHANG